MDYTEITITITEPLQQNTEIVCGFFAEIGYTGFLEEDNSLLAYIPETEFSQDELDELLTDLFEKSFIEDLVKVKTIEKQNWNALWEKNYFKPIAIKNKLYVRGSFHPKDDSFDDEIVIDPKMSFGTGHHQTTKMILEAMIEAQIEGKSIMDMGTGTGILAIYAALRKAKDIDAIDIDDWSVENAIENCKINGFENNIPVKKGDGRILAKLNKSYDLFIANINLGVLLQDLALYEKHLNPGGEMMLSGFLHSDAEDLINESTLELVDRKNEGEWAMLKFKKPLKN